MAELAIPTAVEPLQHTEAKLVTKNSGYYH
jgi:hypothetical protein